jgi:hypothetical protein
MRSKTEISNSHRVGNLQKAHVSSLGENVGFGNEIAHIHS